MAEIIVMPKLGFNMSIGKLVKWYKNEGDSVTKGEPVFEIETDKTSIDIEATQDGVFRKKFIEEGDSIEVTLPIAIIANENENIDALIQDVNRQLNRESSTELPPITAESKPADAPNCVSAGQIKIKSGAVSADKILKITPRAKRAAKEKGIDLNGIVVKGTGYQGGISEKDILAYLVNNKLKASPVAQKIAEAQGISMEDIQGTGINGKVMRRDIDNQTVSQAASAFVGLETENSAAQAKTDGKEILEEIPYVGVRKIIGERLAQSKFTAPHVYFTQKVNLEKLLEIRSQVNNAQERKTSVTDFIAKATIKALKKHPEMNESLVGDKVVKYKNINLGIAVAAPTGLIVPVIKNAQYKSVVEISKDAAEMFEKARMGRLSPDEYSGGTFTISNLGMFGIENFTAIINPPEVGILAVSATKDEPLVVKDKEGNKSIAIMPMMNITLTIDHRLIDGLLAAQFVTEIKRQLENPIELLI